MSRKPTLWQRLQYWRDEIMSYGTPALVIVLTAATLALVVLTALVVYLGHLAPDQKPFAARLWQSLMHAIDPGTVAGDEGPALFLGAMFFVTVGGIFIVSALIGVLSSELDQQLERLRKGRSHVLEEGHIVILGWSPQIFTILSELMIANENRPRARIVVMADEDKVHMEDQIRERVERRGKTRIIVRSGSPIEVNDLEIVNPHHARAFIILPPQSDDPDAYVVKSALALTNSPNRRSEPYHIVTQIHDAQNMDVIRLLGKNDLIHPVLGNDLIARIMAQTARQSGLSVVYTELLNFEGDEIYLQEEPSLVGKTYGEALLAYETSTLIGLRKRDGRVLVNPPMETLIERGDRLFAISADDDTVIPDGHGAARVDVSLIRSDRRTPRPVPEKALILGWNPCLATVIRELDSYVATGSQVLVVADADLEAEIRHCERDLRHQHLAFRRGDTTDRHTLDSLRPAEFDHIIVLSYEGLPVQEADARTLVTLLHLRDIAEHQKTTFSIVSEMLDLRNRQLAEVTNVDDFIVSDHLISLMMAQLAENPDLYAVFFTIFDPKGSEIYLKPIADYVLTGQPVNGYTLVEAARRRGETAIGYRLASEHDDAGKSYGVHINPNKAHEVVFTPEDRIIVLAE